jgi:hypothetical protein
MVCESTFIVAFPLSRAHLPLIAVPLDCGSYKTWQMVAGSPYSRSTEIIPSLPHLLHDAPTLPSCLQRWKGKARCGLGGASLQLLEWGPV